MFLFQVYYSSLGVKAMMLLKFFGPYEFSYSNKKVVYIHHIEFGSACIWSVELKARETDSNMF